jgi:glyoxylase-like metal-dependent hydrolase (beta-lactamase superfamily II)
MTTKEIFCLCAAFVMAAAMPAAAQSSGADKDYTVEVAPGIYNVTWGNRFGNMGLNVGVSVGEDGLLLIDAQEEAAVPRLIARIREITGQPVRYVINTHWHFDHVGGNATFAKDGAVIIAQENTRARLMSEQPNPLGRATQHGFAPAFWPQVTFINKLTLHINGDDVDVLHFPNGHTDGDAIVFFHKANVLFAADLFNNTDYTRVDLRGGSLDGMIAAYDELRREGGAGARADREQEGSSRIPRSDGEAAGPVYWHRTLSTCDLPLSRKVAPAELGRCRFGFVL